MVSKFLESRRSNAKKLVHELRKNFKYVSILGSDCIGKNYRVLKNTTDISESWSTESGFVIKMTNGNAFYEYSLDDISSDVKKLAQKIVSSLNISDDLHKKEITSIEVEDEKMVKSFVRENDLHKYDDKYIIDRLSKYKDELLPLSDNLLNGGASLITLEVNKLFITENKELDQHYTWINSYLNAIYGANDNVINQRESAYSKDLKEALDMLEGKSAKLIDKCKHLVNAKPITPGVYDVITDASITGLIAHEAFGHGVEMDQFVKDRALAKNYVGKYVASPITNMKDGALSGLSTASYFFDDDGVLAHDTQIIKDGILVSGICDLTSSRELDFNPTGNGRRETYKRKAYTRMTNTFIKRGNDKLSDMIKSIKHGYFLFETNNGMEDPKNWAIQCTAEYGIEIVDGKLTDNYVAPVVMSGNVLDLLKSISMISDEFELEGAGSCGKGYKEWVRVSSGGPNLKCKVKLS